MNILAMDGFTQSLIDDTLSGKVTWRGLVHLQGITEESNKALYYALMENEFHFILFLNSFYCFLPSSGYVYLINETTSGGFDDFKVSKTNIYIQKDPSSNIYELTIGLDRVYQLENAIRNTITKDDEEIQNFIDDYYNSK